MKKVPLTGLELREKIILGYMCEWALNNNGETKNFGANTWYGIVDGISYLLEQAEETWDSTYGTVEETYLHPALDSDKTLTARKFNAVTLNIEKILHNKWRWAVDESVENGFLGRPRVHGLTEYGKKGADKVYGWYLLELVRVTNMFIDILQIGEHLSDFNVETSSVSVSSVLSKVLKSAPLPAVIFSGTKTNVPLIPNVAGKMYADSISQTDSYSDLTKIKSINLPLDVLKTKTYSNSRLIAPRVALTYAMSQGKSKICDLEMFARKSIRVEAQALSRTLENAEIRAPGALSVGCVAFDKSSANADAVIVKPLYAVSENVLKTKAQLEMMVSKPKMAIAQITEYSLCSLGIDRLRAKIFECAGNSGSYTDVEFFESEVAHVFCVGESKSNAKAVLSFYTPEPEDTWYDPEQVGANIYIRNAYPQWQKDANVHLDGGVFYQAEQTETNVYIRSAESLKGV